MNMRELLHVLLVVLFTGLLPVQAMAAMDVSLLNGTYKVSELSNTLFKPDLGSVRSVVGGNTIMTTFDGTGGCTVNSTWKEFVEDYSVSPATVLYDQVNFFSDPPFSPSCSYTVDPDGSLTLNLSTIYGTETVGGWRLSPDGSFALKTDGFTERAGSSNGTNYTNRIVVAIKLGSGKTNASLNGTYRIGELDASLYLPAASTVRSVIGGNDILVSFDGSGNCSPTAAWKQYEESFSVSPPTPLYDAVNFSSDPPGAPACTYVVAPDGGVTLTINGTDSIGGWHLSADGNSILKSDVLSEPANPNGTLNSAKILFGIKLGTGMGLASLNGFYRIGELNAALLKPPASSVRSINGGNDIRIAFDGAGNCSGKDSWKEFEEGWAPSTTSSALYDRVALNADVPTPFACTYTVASDGAAVITVDGTDVVSGWHVSANGNNLIKTDVVSETSGNGTTYSAKLLVGTKIQPPLAGTAGGTYAYPAPAAGQLTMTFTSASFPCSGPGIGSEVQDITLLTATTMTWASGMTFTRAAGTAGDITGTWTGYEGNNSGNTYTLTFSAGGALSVSGTIYSCSSTGPQVGSFSPAAGIAGTQVTISGESFYSDPASNLVLFNGTPATVLSAGNNQLTVTVPTGATTGKITVSNPGGVAVSTVPFAVTSTIMNYGGVYHLTNNDASGSPVDVLQMGIAVPGSVLGGMTASVSGPGSFSYTFTDADIRPYLNGQFEVYKEFATQLAAGVYTFTLDDGLGHISHRMDTHTAAALTLPIVDSSKIQYLRKSDGSYRFTWAPVSATRNYYYRLRINRADGSGTPVYLGNRKLDSTDDVPAGTLTDGVAYEARVNLYDGASFDLETNQSNSAYVPFTPQAADYNANRLMFNYATAHYVNGTTPTFGFRVCTTANVCTTTEANQVTSATLSGPSGFSDTLTTANLSHPNDVDFIKAYTTATATSGSYTLDVLANGIHHIAYLTLNATVSVTAMTPVAATYQAEDLGDGNIRFSWADADYTGALYYRVFVNDNPVNNPYVYSGKQNQAYADVPKADLGDMTNKRWRVEVYDSPSTNSQRNRINGTFTGTTVFTSLPAHDPNKPVIDKYHFRSLNRPGGVATELSVDATDADGTLTVVSITGPNSYSRNLLTQGQLSGSTYSLTEAGLPAAGSYTFTVTDNTGKTVTRYNQQPTPHTVPMVDYHTFQVDTELSGDSRFSWAPVETDVPLWYTLEIIDLITLNTVYASPNTDQQKASVTVSKATLDAALLQGPLMFRVKANDGSGFSTSNNISQSVFVGYLPGFNYAALTDTDNDGYASNIDTNDTNPVINPSMPGSIRLTPASINFGNMGVGGSSAPQTITVTNTGGGSVYLASVGQTGNTADFNISSGGVTPCPQLPAYIPPGYGCTLIAYFAPVSTGTKGFTMNLTSNAANNPVSIAMTGTALPVSTTAVTLASGSSPSYLGDAVTYTATVTPGTATGTVQFRVDGVDSGSPVAVSGGAATSAAISNMSLGSHSVTAVYSGDGALFGSTSTGYTQTVNEKLQINGNSNFLTLDAAIKAYVNNDILKLRDTRFAEDITVVLAQGTDTLTLKGGLGTDFTTPGASLTSLKSLKIKVGRVNVSRVAIKPN